MTGETEHIDRPDIGPTAPRERIAALDAARGLALLGILVVNMRGFSSPDLYAQLLPAAGDKPWYDEWSRTLVDFMVQGKFYTLFSFLFGAGFVLFMDRAKAKRGMKPGLLMTRRLAMLLGFGLAHALLLWWGDILLMYAVCGFALLPVWQAKARTLKAWGAGMLAFAVLAVALLTCLSMWAERFDPAGTERLTSSMIEDYEREASESRLHYGSGGWSDAFGQRLDDWGLMLESAPINAFIVFAMFLFGAAAARSGWLARLADDRGARRKALLAFGTAAAALSGIKLWAKAGIDPYHPGWADIVHFAASCTADPAGSLFYFAAACALVSSGAKTAVLRSAGRMALTVYLCQSALFTTLFYGYGAGWYGRTGDLANVLLAGAGYALLALGAHWWMRRFGQGPLERLWRAATYGRFAIGRKNMR